LGWRRPLDVTEEIRGPLGVAAKNNKGDRWGAELKEVDHRRAEIPGTELLPGTWIGIGGKEPECSEKAKKVSTARVKESLLDLAERQIASFSLSHCQTIADTAE
jgi:hypothetical protein